MDFEQLKLTVHEALDNAMENGYDLRCWTNQAIAMDLVTYESQLENQSLDDLIDHIETWRAKYRLNGEGI